MRKQYDALNADPQTAKERDELFKKTGFKGSYSLQQVPGHERVCQSAVDGMHTLADFVKSLTTVISGQMSQKAKRHEELYRHTSHSSHNEVGSTNRTRPGQKRPAPRDKQPNSQKSAKRRKHDSQMTTHAKGPWELDKAGIRIADQRACSITYPPSCSLRPDPYFSSPRSLNKMEMLIKVYM